MSKNVTVKGKKGLIKQFDILSQMSTYCVAEISAEVSMLNQLAQGMKSLSPCGQKLLFQTREHNHSPGSLCSCVANWANELTVATCMNAET